MSQPIIELKGSTFTLSVIYLYTENINEIKNALIEKMSQAPAFLKYAPIVINVSHLDTFQDWAKLKQVVNSVGFFLVGISGCKNEQQKTLLHEVGIATVNEGKLPEAPKSQQHTIPEKNTLPENDSSAIEATNQATDTLAVNNIEAIAQPINEIPIPKTKVITTPVRSGQQIYARNADLVVLNNVGAGAEIIADGNIHVYGIMRGKALAGASGDENAQIFCQQLEAEVISIAGNYWLNEQIPKQFINKASHISFNEGEINITSL